jgi:hypothetical protein
VYGLPLDGRLKTNALDLVSYSDLADEGTARIFVAQAPKGQNLTVRRPQWAETLNIKLNGVGVNGIHKDNGLAVQIATGDHVEIDYLFATRSTQAGIGGPLKARAAFFAGPWLLGCSSLTNVHYFNEMQADNLIDPHLMPSNAAMVHSPFAVPIAARSVAYLPAEYAVQPARGELRAIAEQTAGPSARWEMAFRTLSSRS